MSFIVEPRLSDEDKKRFGYNTWVIDREREIFMIPSGIGRESQRSFELFDYKDGSFLLKAHVTDKSTGNSKDGLLRWYEIHHLQIPYAIQHREAELVPILLEAMDEYGHDLPINATGSCVVKVTFSGYIYHGIENERIYKGISK